MRCTDEAEYFVSEASVYRLLKAHDLIASPAYIVIKAAEEFKDKTTAPNQLWQTNFTYLKITGWGWCYLSTVLDDFSRRRQSNCIRRRVARHARSQATPYPASARHSANAIKRLCL